MIPAVLLSCMDIRLNPKSIYGECGVELANSLLVERMSIMSHSG